MSLLSLQRFLYVHPSQDCKGNRFALTTESSSTAASRRIYEFPLPTQSLSTTLRNASARVRHIITSLARMKRTHLQFEYQSTRFNPDVSVSNLLFIMLGSSSSRSPRRHVDKSQKSKSRLFNLLRDNRLSISVVVFAGGHLGRLQRRLGQLTTWCVAVASCQANHLFLSP